MPKKARVLVTTVIDGEVYRPDEIIETSAAKIKALGSAVDASADAIKYCTDELKRKVIRIHDDNEKIEIT
jgi:hypothetical protein